MSGFLSGALGSLMQSEGGAGAASGLLNQAFSAAGGVPGIIARFQAAGLGDKVQSWVGTGGNVPLAASELTRVFPPEQIEAWASAHGVPAGVATEMLAHLMPHAVDSQTPGGQVPDQDDPFADGQSQPTPSAASPDAPPQASPGQGFDFGGLLQRLMAGR